MKSIPSKLMFKYLLVLSVCVTASFQAWRTLFNNFAVEVANLGSFDVGLIQSIRECPGFLSLLSVYLLLFLRENTIASLSVLLMGIGVSLVGFFPSIHGIILTTLLMSFGFHYFETRNQSLTMQYFSKKETPFVFAQIQRYTALASVMTGAIIWLLSFVWSYKPIYLLFGAIAIMGAIWGLNQNPLSEEISAQKKKMVFKKKYWLYYLLSFLSGARRQIFVVFAVFLMVKKFDFTIATITTLFVANNIINFFIFPYIAKAINRFGERKVLLTEYGSLIFIFVAYAYTNSPIFIAILYIVDSVVFNFSIALKTYFQKIAAPQDIAPTAGISFTINHIAAVIIPFIGGILWQYNYQIPFFAGAVIALCSISLTMLLPKNLHLEE